jgi:hypothetical protein
MSDREVFSKIIRISKEKTTFMLSEIIPDLKHAKNDKKTQDIIEEIKKQLPGIGLSMKKTGNDYELPWRL